MSKCAKYFIINYQGTELMFTFPHVIAHKDMLHSVRTMMVGHGRNWSRPYRDATLVSAGFMTNEAHCYGRSQSLNIESRPDDGELFKCGSMRSVQAALPIE